MRLIILLLFIFTSFSIDSLIGKASFYHDKFEGRKTASGEIFSQHKLTAASNNFKLGTKVKVTNLKNNKIVVVKINDRMAVWTQNKGRIIDLSKKAAKILNINGIGKVKVEEI